MMPKVYAMVGQNSGTLLSFGGKVIVHTDPNEIHYLVPSVRIVEINPNAQLTMRLKDHPDLCSVRWPLNRRDFR
jgi:hypothetical protein